MPRAASDVWEFFEKDVVKNVCICKCPLKKPENCEEDDPVPVCLQEIKVRIA